MTVHKDYEIEATSIDHFLDIVESMGGKDINMNAISTVYADCLVKGQPRRFWYKEAQR